MSLRHLYLQGKRAWMPDTRKASGLLGAIEAGAIWSHCRA
jgi:hypothetical protein